MTDEHHRGTAASGADPSLAGRAPRIELRELLALAALLAALWVGAGMSADFAHQQRQHRSALLGEEGAHALQQGRPSDAVNVLRRAVALAPHDMAHRLTLGKALVAMDHPAEALPYIQEVLAVQPVDGEANLVLARILRRLGAADDAEAAYYRAIYGRWAIAQQTLRVQPRLELISLFRQAGQRERLRSALLELSAAFPGDRALQLQAGRELLEAGFADDAARQLRALVERLADPGNGLALLARAEFARGHIVEAYAASGRAVRHSPDDPAASHLHRVSGRMLSLDPDQPRLSSAERRRRIRVLLTEGRGRLAACEVRHLPPTSPSLLPAVDRWVASRRPDGDLGRALLGAVSASLMARCSADLDDDAAGLLLKQLGEGRAAS